MPHVPITLLYGSISILMLGLLGLNVSRVRTAKKVYITTDAPTPALQRVIRSHGNAAEWIPALVVMLLILELSGGASMPLHIFGGSIVLGRVLHGAGVLTKTPVSTVGATITYVLMLAMPIYGFMLHTHG